jgi:two-component system sensor histidine kinase EvgS
VGNAVKYTPAGQVLVRAGLDAEVDADGAGAGADNGWLRILVQDTGVGIPLAQQAALFTPFGAGTGGGLAGGEHSHGLGLAICKRLVQAMQGEISLTSQPGAGTEVLLRLPLVVPAADAGPVEPVAPAPAPRGSQVLLVDDDALSRLLLAELLRAAGYAVIEAADADQALAAWQAQPVGAVISDRHMPGTDGPALLRRIADEARARGLPPPCRILCTGHPGDPEALGVDAVLDKPVTLAALRRVLMASGVHPVVDLRG